MRIQQPWKFWSPAALLGLFAGNSVTPLSSLADIDEPRIGIVHDASLQPVAFEATGLSRRELRYLKSAAPKSDACSRIFAVFQANGSEDVSTSPISGSYVVDGDRLKFLPCHPLQAGLKYLAVLQVHGILPADRPLSGVAVHCEIAIPGPPANATAESV
jgi:hypothetical protein